MKAMTLRFGCAALVAASTLTLAGMALPRARAVSGAGVAAAHAADTYTIDPIHSSVIFKVKHMGVSWIYGRFNDVSGEIVWSPEDLSKHSIKAKVKAASVDTNSSARDKDLRGPDFFDTANFPTITFESTGVKESGTDKFEVSGKLTMHGVSKSITILLEKVGSGGKKIGVATEFTVKRSDFGMTYGVGGPVSDEVTIMLGFEATTGS